MRYSVLISSLIISAGMAYGAVPTNEAERLEMDRFINELLSKMTLEEKLGQLNLPVCGDIVTGQTIESDIGATVARGEAGGTFNIKGAHKAKELQEIAVTKTRLGIPLLVGLDVIHGYETVFPIPLALSCSWDMEAVEESARIAASEASAAGVNWTFSPMVDICRDPRWGRMSEGAGEDPYLGSCIARAMVRGYQGDALRDRDNILACVKHFALYGGSEAGRDYNTVDMSRLRMYNEYLPPYKAAVEEGVGTVMSSFNLVDYVPATENKWLLDDLLRKQWGFDGMVVTDYGSIGDITTHGLEQMPEASARALEAGTDMDMCSSGFISTLKQSVEKGTVSVSSVDKAVRRVLEAKYKLGLFENPYKYNDVSREKTDIYTRKNRDAARRIASETFVLLKNDNSILPLSKKGTIALVGPLAEAGTNMSGSWSVVADLKRHKSLRQGFEDAIRGKAKLVYAKGANLEDDPALEAAATGGRTIRDSRSAEEMLA